MIRLVITGLWICLVTALSTYAATMWETRTTPAAEVDQLFGGLRSMQTSTISVPVIDKGGVQGYVLAQFTFTMNSEIVNRMSITPDVFLLDAAFRTIYATDAETLSGSKKQNFQNLTAAIKKRVNERFGHDFVVDVLIEKFNFVSKDQTRQGLEQIKSRPEF